MIEYKKLGENIDKNKKQKDNHSDTENYEIIKDELLIQKNLMYRIDRSNDIFKENEFKSNPMEIFLKCLNYAFSNKIKEYSFCILNILLTETLFPVTRKTKLLDVKNSNLYFGGNFYRELSISPISSTASIIFDWSLLDLQIEMTGLFQECSEKEMNYYYSRLTREEQKCLTIFDKTKKIDHRDKLIYKYQNIPKGTFYYKPPYWKVYQFSPFRFEFIKKHSNFLDDRIIYTQSSTSDNTQDTTKKWSFYRSYPIL